MDGYSCRREREEKKEKTSLINIKKCTRTRSSASSLCVRTVELAMVGERRERETNALLLHTRTRTTRKKNANKERQRKEFVKMHINVFSDVKKLIVQCIEKRNDAMTILTYVQVLLLDYSIQHLGHNRLTTDFECNSELNFHGDDQRSKKPEEKKKHLVFFFDQNQKKQKQRTS